MNSHKFHFFWDGPLSQWYRSSFVVDGVKYYTAEQYMMAMKARHFGDADSEEKIMKTWNADEQKALGRKVKNFVPEVWSQVSKDYVFKGNLAKFSNPRLKELLLATGDLEIVEASPHDKIWGIGLSAADPRALDKSEWQGTNWLGEVLMRVRKELKNEQR